MHQTSIAGEFITGKFNTEGFHLKSASNLVLLAESEGYWPELRLALEMGRVARPQIHDARIAALGHSHGVRELWTADR